MQSTHQPVEWNPTEYFPSTMQATGATGPQRTAPNTDIKNLPPASLRWMEYAMSDMYVDDSSPAYTGPEAAERWQFNLVGVLNKFNHKWLVMRSLISGYLAFAA